MHQLWMSWVPGVVATTWKEARHLPLGSSGLVAMTLFSAMGWQNRERTAVELQRDPVRTGKRREREREEEEKAGEMVKGEWTVLSGRLNAGIER